LFPGASAVRIRTASTRRTRATRRCFRRWSAPPLSDVDATDLVRQLSGPEGQKVRRAIAQRLCDAMDTALRKGVATKKLTKTTTATPLRRRRRRVVGALLRIHLDKQLRRGLGGVATLATVGLLVARSFWNTKLTPSACRWGPLGTAQIAPEAPTPMSDISPVRVEGEEEIGCASLASATSPLSLVQDHRFL